MVHIAPRPATARRSLHFGIDTPVPSSVAADRGVVYLSGWCFDDNEEIKRLELTVNGLPQPVVAWRMPRHQVAVEFAGQGGRASRAYRSGFWGFAELRPGVRWAVGLRAWTASGEFDLELGSVAASTQLSSRSGRDDVPTTATPRPEIAICMATFNPPLSSLKAQIDSIRAQTYDNWICVISDDHSICATEMSWNR
jgi:hypothetical protein